MKLCTTLENLDNIPDGNTRKIINYTAGDGIDITNGVISATGGGTSSNSTIGTIVASPASGNTNLGSFNAWGWKRVPLTRVIRQVNSSFALEDNFLVNKSNKTINVLVSANGMFEYSSSVSQTTYDMCIDYRTPTITIGAISEAYVKVPNAFNSVVVSPMLVAVEPGAKLSLSLRFDNDGTAKVNGDNTFITIQELEVPVFFGNESSIISSPTVLFNDDAGTKSNVTLSDSVVNYEYIEIFFRTNDYTYNSVKVYKPNGKVVSLMSIYNNNDDRIWFKSTLYTISGTTMSVGNNVEARLINNSSAGVWNSSNVYVTRVIGYK